MTTFLNILFWTAIAFGAVATVLTLIRLTVGDAVRGKAKPGARASAWRLCATASESCWARLAT